MSGRFSFSYLRCCYLFLLIVASFFHLGLSFNKSFDDDVLCMGRERRALLQFKHDLIDETGLLAYWDVRNRDCCTWGGIICDPSGHIREIDLRALDGHCDDSDSNTNEESEAASKQRLRGNLNSSLVHLKKLEYLDLSCNNFEGIQVPKFIGSLRNLKYLNLSYSEFDGIIPPQLGNLSELHVLSLGSFQSHFETTSMMNMEWLSSLRLLRHLDLSGVDLSKSVNWLQVINTLPSLVQLHLSNNILSDIHPHIPNVNLTSLSLLDLSRNNFESPLPQWISSITSLVSLDLSYCYFHSPTPNSIGFRNLTSLKSLHVLGNDFMNSSFVLEDLSSVGGNLISLDISSCSVSSATLDSLHNLTSLRSLDLSDNQLTTRIPKALGDLCNLRDLDLSNNDFSNITLSSLLQSVFECKYPVLRSLSLSFSELSGTIPSSLSRLAFLRSLELNQNLISGPIPSEIGELPSLEMLDLSNNLFDGSLHNFLCSNGMKETNALYFGNNHLSGAIPDCWNRWSELIILNLQNNNLSGRIPTTLGFLSELGSLNMRGNKLSGTLPISLMNLSRLKILRLSKNALVGSIPSWLGTTLSHLKLLNLRYNNFVGNIPHKLCHLKHIQILDLAYNNLSGEIPTCFNNFRVLTGKETLYNEIKFNIMDRVVGYGSDSLVIKGREATYRTFLGLVTLLDLSCNNLVGNIPSELTSLTALQTLNLSRNQLTGGIPQKIGDMKALISFDLSVNILSGELPVSLSSLNFLTNFNVSYNNLTGRVPSSTQLQSLNESSFCGNKLYGPPLTEGWAVEVEVSDSEGQKEEDGADWGLIISIVLGFVSGFWIVLAPLIVSRSRRIAYFRFIGERGYMVYDSMLKFCFNMFAKISSNNKIHLC